MLLWQITTTGGATLRVKSVELKSSDDTGYCDRISGTGLDGHSYFIPQDAIAAIAIIDFDGELKEPQVGFDTNPSAPETP